MLKLYWMDTKDNKYILGDLYKDNDQYVFEINQQGLKEATNNGCFGIGELNLLYSKHVSDTLFDFFKRRIPSENDVNINEILAELQMDKYDEMELLRRTKGQMFTDRYFLEE